MKSKERFSCLREKRVNGRPASLIKMDRWLTVRKVDLDDHVRDLEEKVAVEGEQGLEDCEVNDDGDEDLEMGAEDSLGLTDDEEVYSDNLNDSSDSE